jgi:YHS domain-containing protein
MVGGHDHDAMVGVSQERQAELERAPWSDKLRSRGAWADAASYAVADATMLRRELLIGYGVAGFLTVFVSNDVWNSVFMTGHGFWTTLENVIIGPFIAIISFVCSIGNVPMAAALWHGGISFGGVIAFIFGDLITIPLLLIYRKYYGGRLTVRLLFWFWVVMSTAGLITELLFDAAGLIPTDRTTTMIETSFKWNYTTFLNLAFIALAGYLYWLYRNRERLGGGAGYAIDPVCGMQVQTANAPAHLTHDGADHWFCSDRCAEKFAADPERHSAGRGTEPLAADAPPAARVAVDPVCGMSVDPERAAAHREYHGDDYFFCGAGCADSFDASPARYVEDAPSAA